MLISSQSFKRFCCLLTCVVFTPIFILPAVADAPTSSIKMPKASKSLLLDIEAVGSKVVAVGERGHILVSEDQGQSWVQADVPVVQMLNAVDFASEKLGWAVGHDGNIVHTQDGGETWILQREGLKAQNEANISAVSAAKIKVKELEDRIAQAALSESESGDLAADIAAAGDAESLSLDEQLEEANWELESAEERLANPAIAAPLMDVWFADESNGWVTGAFGVLLQTTDGGKTWADRSKSIDNSDGNHLNAVIGHGANIFIAGEAGYMIYSHDNGQTWMQADLGYDGTIFGLFAAADGSFVIATGLRGNTFRTEDAGISWQPLNPQVDYSLANGCAYGSTHIVLVGTGGSISVSDDNGNSFKHYTLPARASLSSITVLENGQFLMVGQGGVHHFDVNAVAE